MAAPLAADAALTQLSNLLNTYKTQKKNKEVNSQIIHVLQLIKMITSTNSWPVNKIEELCDILLEISKTSDQFLVSSAFGAFEGLFQSMTDVIDVEKFTRVLNVIFDLKPSINDTHLAASWLAVVAKALESLPCYLQNPVLPNYLLCYLLFHHTWHLNQRIFIVVLHSALLLLFLNQFQINSCCSHLQQMESRARFMKQLMTP